MARIQFISEPEIKALIVRHGTMRRIEGGDLRKTEKDRGPAKSVPAGQSLIYNYHEESGAYVATAHKLIRSSGDTAHCDVKRVVAGNNDYRVPKKIVPPDQAKEKG